MGGKELMIPDMRRTYAIFLAAALSAGNVWADHEPEGEDAVKEGHSGMGESFNEGPRQAAYLMGATGDVHFEVTTSVAEAQKFFDQGIGQLHGFWYFEAERSFRQVLALDPECGMAYWGMAMANFGNETRAKGFIEKAVEAKKAGKMTKWETMWIDATAGYLSGEPADKKKRCREHIRAVEGIVHAFPEHVEPKAFLCGMAYHYRNEVPISSHMALDALLDQVFAKSPKHPAHHYRIHLWDGERPERALESSAELADTARSTAHMWHMPGHIYDKLGRYSDAAWHQEAAARVDHGQMARNRVLPDQIHNYAHNQEWLIRSLTGLGRAGYAEQLAREMVEVPRHPKWNTLEKKGRCAGLGRQRLAEVLETFEKWEALVAACGNGYLDRTEDVGEQVRHFRARAAGYFGLGDGGLLGELSGELEALKAESEKERDEAVEKEKEAFEAQVSAGSSEKVEGEKAKGEEEKKAAAEKKKAHEKAVADLKKKYGNRIAEYEKVRGTVGVYRAALSGDLAKVEEGMKKDRFGALAKARIWLRAGELKKAEEEARKAADEGKGKRVANLIVLVEVLEKAGKGSEADEAWKRVVANSAEMDLDLPALGRIEGVMRRNGCDPGADWREKVVLADDIMERPPLDELGPSKWNPFPAEAWSLSGVDGETVSLSSYHGKPVVVIFYLGFGCLHCVEQLQAFAPEVEKFREMGIEVVSVSTDAPEKMREDLADYEAEGKSFTIRLVSDSSLEVFKKYRAYDDFEGKPLHGTYLIDGEGKIRWQDIGYEPFTDVGFLLGEARRLLGK